MRTCHTHFLRTVRQLWRCHYDPGLTDGRQLAPCAFGLLLTKKVGAYNISKDSPIFRQHEKPGSGWTLREEHYYTNKLPCAVPQMEEFQNGPDQLVGWKQPYNFLI